MNRGRQDILPENKKRCSAAGFGLGDIIYVIEHSFLS